jgi:hypothetical protein
MKIFLRPRQRACALDDQSSSPRPSPYRRREAGTAIEGTARPVTYVLDTNAVSRAGAAKAVREGYPVRC